MCGITGFWGSPFPNENILTRMAAVLQHRGPDNLGTWIDNQTGLGLAHRRLSILDRSPAGHQPMISSCGRYVLVYNGEIYNHIDLRRQLDKDCAENQWRGSSDSETLLAGLRHWGVEGCLMKLNGMFAFAYWDRNEQKLYLARDRMGEKPLFFGINNQNFYFGSELKAITMHPQWRGEINRNAIASFMRYNHVPGPDSIYCGVNKLQPAHYVVISQEGRHISSPRSYWSLSEVASLGINAANSDQPQSVMSLSDELDDLARNAVGLRMLADVPLGAFLSGGYDSTFIVAQMQAQSRHRVKTFSIGCSDDQYDESKYAALIAQHLGTEHNSLFVTAQDALAVIPKLPSMYDEPFADSSQIPTFLVSELARRDVAVVLSGDGGDELFAGYSRHVFGPSVWNNINKVPIWLRRCFANQLSCSVNQLQSYWLKQITSQFHYPGLPLKLGKLASALAANNELEFYDQLRAHWRESDIVLDGTFNMPYSRIENANMLEQMLYQDMQSFLPDDILTKVDRASMAVSLEARSPFLDHRLVEFAWRVPSQLKICNGKGKWLLREVLKRYVPSHLMERPKQGFDIPIANWLRGPLRDWAESLLNESRLRKEGYLNAKLIRSVWQDHLNGYGNREHDLWCALMFQGWLEKNN